MNQSSSVPFDIPVFNARAPWFGGDLQTLRNFFMVEIRGAYENPTTSERLHLPLDDGTGDQLLGDLTIVPESLKPLVVLIHGLTGCSGSSYVLRSSQILEKSGYSSLSINLRGAGPGLKYATDCYHAGRTGDLVQALESFQKLRPDLCEAGICLIGYSLGGNMLLRFLGEIAGQGNRIAGIGVHAGVTVCAPLDLMATSKQFQSTRNIFYHRWLLGRLKQDILGLPLSEADKDKIRKARSVYEFDDIFLAPRFGFGTAPQYYEATSAGHALNAIRVPTLLLHARNDPWVPAESYDACDFTGNPDLSVFVARSGGHVGFHQRHPQNHPWHDVVIQNFLSQAVPEEKWKTDF